MPTIPSDVYAGQRWPEERDLFSRVWRIVCRTADVDVPGRWVTADLDGRPVLVVCGADGQRRAFENRCRHRRTVIARGPAGFCPKGLVCPYHGIRYDLQGVVTFVPEGDVYPSEVREGRLPRVNTAEWGGFVFVSGAADPVPFDTFVPVALRESLARWRLDRLTRVETRSWEMAFDWKLGVEGFIEPFHAPYLHPRSVAPFVRFRDVAFERFGDHSSMVLPFRLENLYEPEGVLGAPAAACGVEPFGPRTHNHVYLLFPNVILNLLPHHVAVITFWPVGPGQTRVSLELLAETAATEAARAFVATLWANQVQLVTEDLDNLVWTQRGVNGDDAGPLHLTSYEARLVWFREALARWAGERPPSAFSPC